MSSCRNALARLRGRLPTRQEIGLAFSTCVVVLYSWSIFVFLKQVPALLLRLSAWDLAGYVAYLLAYALVESVLLLLGLLLLAILAPEAWLRKRFAALGSATVCLLAMWSIADEFGLVRLWQGKSSLPWLALCLASVVVGLWAVIRYKRLASLFSSLAERLTVLSVPYVMAGLVSLVLIVVRNV